MEFSHTEIETALRVAGGLPDGPARVAAIEEAVRAADVVRDVAWQFYTRHELICAAFCAGEADKLYVALSWCLGKCDEHPEAVDWSNLLWQCKHALSYATAFPSISRQQIEQLGADVIARYETHGASLRGPYAIIMSGQLSLGDIDDAKETHRRWREAPRDDFAEPWEWETYFEALYLKLLDEDDRALETAQPLLDDPGRFREVYPWVVDLVLMELLRRGDIERAASLFRKSARMCMKNPRFLYHVSTQLAFLALTKNFSRAVRMFEPHLPWRQRSPVPGARLAFDLDAWQLMRRLQAHDRASLKLRLPADFPLHRAEGRYETSLLADWFETQVRDLESQFNARNGNRSMSEWIERTIKLEEHAIDYPIKH